MELGFCWHHIIHDIKHTNSMKCVPYNKVTMKLRICFNSPEKYSQKW